MGDRSGWAGAECSASVAGAFAYCFHIGAAVQWGLVTLRLPDGFTEAIKHVVECRVAVALATLAGLEGFPDARGLVDGELLLDGQVQGEMQEGVDLAILRAEVLQHRLGIFKQGVVLGMMGDQIGSDDLELGQNLAVPVLGPGADKELAGLISGRIEPEGGFLGEREGSSGLRLGGLRGAVEGKALVGSTNRASMGSGHEGRSD